MAESQQALDADEIAFLLEGDDARNRPAPAEGTISEADFVTIRGDLANISLTDIFQTLCMSQMTGTLRIRSAIATRQVYFQDGKVQMVDDQRVRSVQIGTRLRQAGLIGEEDLNQALAVQRRQGGRLGDLLVEKGVVDRDQMEEFLRSHEQEEVYALFTWKRATFEFFKGEEPPQGSHRSESFDVSGILLEVARRQDEWGLIWDNIGDLDEVMVRVEEAVGDLPDPAADRVLALVDGSRSVREIAASSLIPLFECAKAVSVHLERGVLRKATLAELSALVERHAREGRPREAVSTLALLREEREVGCAEEARMVAAACFAAHDPRAGAQVLVGMATRLAGSAPGLAFELLGEACGMDPGNAEARLIRRKYLDPSESLIEIRKLTLELCDIFCEAGKLELALEEARNLKEAGGLDPAVLARLARVNHKAGNREEAEKALDQLAAIFREQGKSAQLVAVLDQITKLNPARRDAARELREIKTSKLDRKRRRLITVGSIAALGLALALGGTVLLKRMREQALLERLEAIAAGPGPSAEELDTARRILAERPDTPAADIARRVLEKDPERLRATREKQEREERIREGFEEGQELKDQGHLTAALEVYQRLLPDIQGSPRHTGILATVRLPEIAKHLQRLAQTRAETLARLKGLAASFNRWENALVPARELADPANERELRRLEAFLPEWPFQPIAEGIDPGQIAASISELDALHKEARLLLDGLEVRYGEHLLARELDPLIQGAREAEATHDFEQALRLYTEVAGRYQKDNELSAFLQGRVRKYRDILGHLTELAGRTEANDHKAAAGLLAYLEGAHPGIPFAEMVALPLRIESVPSGARVRLGGVVHGNTPLQVRFHPSETTSLGLELEGFRGEEASIQGVGAGLLKVWLAPVPAWRAPLNGVVDSAPALLGEDILVGDRAGTLYRLGGKEGQVLWRFESNDLSGKLSTPLVKDGRVFIASPEAGLRCLEGQSGKELWRRPLAGTPIGAPLGVPRAVVVATEKGRLHSFALPGGEPLWELDLDGEATAAPAFGEGSLFLATRPGALLARDPATGAPRWARNLPDLCLAEPVVHSGRVLVACLDGTILALGASRGETLWTARLGVPCRLPVLVWGKRILVLPVAREARVLSLADGAPVRSIPLPAAPSAPAALAGTHLFLGLENGHLLALGAEDLEPRWRHPASRALLAPVVGKGSMLYLATQEREVLAFPEGR